MDTVDIEDIEDIVGAADIVDTGVRVFGSLVVQVVQVAVPGAVQQWALGGTWAGDLYTQSGHNHRPGHSSEQLSRQCQVRPHTRHTDEVILTMKLSSARSAAL